MRLFLLLLLIIVVHPLASEEMISEAKKVARKISLNLIIHDHQQALKEARKAKEKWPNNAELHQLLIKAFVEHGLSKEALNSWENYREKFSDVNSQELLLEEVAWCMIKEAADSWHMGTGHVAMIAATLTRDAYALPIILKNMRSSNSLLRATAVRLAPHLNDASLQKEVLKILQEEKVEYVRLEAIKAIGTMALSFGKTILQEIVSSNESSPEERVAAILSLKELLSEVSTEELYPLIKSDRFGLRVLACEYAGYFAIKAVKEEIINLLDDSHSDVRSAAIRALGLLGEGTIEIVEKMQKDAHHEVAMTAAWLHLLVNQEKGSETLQPWLMDSRKSVREFAAGALAASGKQGITLAKKIIKESSDPYLKATLAFALIRQNEDVEKMCEQLFSFLEKEKGKVMWKNQSNGMFRSLAESEVRQRLGVPNYPEMINQVTRLDLLNILAIKRYPKADEAIEKFLRKKGWGITVEAAYLLLEEGDSSMVEIIREIMEEKEKNLSLQAALALAIWGKEEKAIDFLEKNYKKATRDKKLMILEAISWIGTKNSLPFLVEVLHEPFPTLRAAAASAIIQALRK